MEIDFFLYSWFDFKNGSVFVEMFESELLFGLKVNIKLGLTLLREECEMKSLGGLTSHFYNLLS